MKCVENPIEPKPLMFHEFNEASLKINSEWGEKA